MPIQNFDFNGSLLALDARPDRLDIRDRMYTPRVSNLPPCHPGVADIVPALPAYIEKGLVLNQGKEGACTGFGLAAVINYLFWRRDPANVQVSPRMLYHLAKFYDEWAGEDYVGSSCRGALKGWHKHGVCSRSLWPYTVAADNTVPAFEAPLDGWEHDALKRPLGVYYRVEKDSVTDMQAAIVECGAIYVSGGVHKGWGEVTAATAGFASLEQLPVIDLHTEKSGGHAFALIGYDDRGFIVQNSWGTGWGYQGFAILRYEDWLLHGTDAWAIALGVPLRNVLSPVVDGQAAPAAPSAFRSGSVNDHTFVRTARAGLTRLSQDQAYGLTVVMGNDGGLIQRLVAVADARAAVEQVVLKAPRAWQQGRGGPLKLAIYAHGGLNSEQASLARIADMAPYFLANGIYPLFVTWKTGPGESLLDILEDQLRARLPSDDQSGGRLGDLKDGALEVLDRSIEALAESGGGKALWQQMKQNAALAAEAADRGLCVLADYLQQLHLTLGGQLEIHLIGHSAGSIVHGHLLDLLRTKSMLVQSCSLYAPACTIAFANAHYRPALVDGTLKRDRFHLHMLSDAREQDDNVARIYNKSLLYLVARAFESRHKTPLLGMATSLDARYFSGATIPDQWHPATLDDLRNWNACYWNGAPPSGFAGDGNGLPPAQSQTLHIVNDKYVNDGEEQIRSAHGAFDNDIATVAQTIARIRGCAVGLLPQPVTDLHY